MRGRRYVDKHLRDAVKILIQDADAGHKFPVKGFEDRVRDGVRDESGFPEVKKYLKIILDFVERNRYMPMHDILAMITDYISAMPWEKIGDTAHYILYYAEQYIIYYTDR